MSSECPRIQCFQQFAFTWLVVTGTWMDYFSHHIPIGSMYGIFIYIWVIYGANVGKYSIHGSYGIRKFIISFDEVIFFRVVGIHTTNQSLFFNGYTKAESTDFCDWQGARGTLDEDSGGVAVMMDLGPLCNGDCGIRDQTIKGGYPLVMTNS